MADYYLAIEIGGTNLRYGVIDEDFRVLDFQKEPSRLLSDAEDKGAYIENLVRPYLDQYGQEHFKHSYPGGKPHHHGGDREDKYSEGTYPRRSHSYFYTAAYSISNNLFFCGWILQRSA